MRTLKSEIPSLARSEQAEEMIAEFAKTKSSLDGSLGLGRASSYEEWLDYIRIHQEKRNLPEGHVLTSAYFAVREADDEIIGIYNVRHYVNDVLKESGNGNIGYCVRPTERSKGYGTMLLEMALDECRSLGMHTVHVSCYKSNVHSGKVILNNGGKLHKKYSRDDGEFLEYIIDIIKKD